MRDVFTTFASSRFVDREAVVNFLRRCARRLKSEENQVEAVHLFGSFASGTATPRSDADIVVEIADEAEDLKDQIENSARYIFLEAPVPVDLFVMTFTRLAKGGGVATLASRQGIQLA
ncbi:nucleotidyltransferase domain-containing protein [Acidobacteria bacterium AH-259-A15]|nr:nucleotidyltransferase domain-containing protein [Acidobacteria bacterium AH-259-A15]